MLYKTGERTIEGYDTPYVPSGFEHTEGTWNTGYVIKDTSNGNEFVWVPVNGTDVKIKRNINRHLLKLQKWQMQKDCPMASIV